MFLSEAGYVDITAEQRLTANESKESSYINRLSLRISGTSDKNAEGLLSAPKETEVISPAPQNYPPGTSLEEKSTMSIETEKMEFTNQKVEEMMVGSQGSSSSLTGLSGKVTLDTDLDKEKGESKVETKTGKNIILEDKGKEEQTQEDKDKDEDEMGEIKRKSSDDELRKFNRRVPEERSAVKKDQIEEHFDR